MAFLGFVFFMGIVKLPKISMFFCINPRIYQVAVVFSRNQFFQLLKYLHVSVLTELPARDCPDCKLFRITPVIDTLRRTFQQIYNLHCEQSILMVKDKGKDNFLQNNMPMNLTKEGLKYSVNGIQAMATSANLKFTQRKTMRMKIKL